MFCRLTGSDLSAYVFHQLRGQISVQQSDASAGENPSDATEEESKKVNRFAKLKTEIDQYLEKTHSLTDMHQVCN
jgi:hypothetical protein